MDIANITLLGVYWGDTTLPNIYRRSWVTDDNTVLHNRPKCLDFTRHYENKSCLHCTNRQDCELNWAKNCKLDFSINNPLHLFNAVCEFTRKRNKNQIESVSVQYTNTTFLPLKQYLTLCQSGQITHLFLACGPQSVCGQRRVTPCTFSNVWHGSSSPGSVDEHALPVVLYSCDGDETKLSYTVLCDFRQDCQDKSDEKFCKHPPCDDVTCTNGQCVSYNDLCDRLSHCLDNSDESNCAKFRVHRTKHQVIPAPALIDFDGIGEFIVTKMKLNKLCPNTHYRCPGDFNNCLPIYTRCNGVNDCVDHEDEKSCDEIMCPGYFQCQSSSICVHVNHLCDGWPHCPMNDDELFCGMVCPKVCLCHGHCFFCPQAFSAHLFPDLRYLDATGSGMLPSDMSNNTYLVHLSLSWCSLAVLPAMKLSNLRFIDLSNNKLQHIDLSVFVNLGNLQMLSLANNPVSLLCSDPASVTQQNALRSLDLSHTMLTVFDSQALSSFLSIQKLDLSFTNIHTISPTGFNFTPHLTTLRMEGTPVKIFQSDVFQNLHHLHSISSDNFKLCCKDVLPSHFEDRFCSAPRDEISSCEDLLQTNMYRAFLWLTSCLSLTGNTVCCVVRCSSVKTSVSSFSLFVTNLSIADLLMGIYINFIGVADAVYQGRYFYHDIVWKNSLFCKVAGFLSLLSSEVSALTIWLITLDRFIVLHFPFSNLKFKRSSAIVACLVSWTIGLLLASVPLLPVTSHWEFYGQTGMCIPLPVTRNDFKGRLYSFCVMIVFNFVLFVLISTGQAFIYWTVKKNSLATNTTKISQDMTIAGRLIAVAVTDFMCWFPIGVCGMLALADVPIPGEVNVALTVFVLPLNSALNPFVYTYNTLVEKRRKLKEAKLLKWLESHMDLLEN